MKKSFLGFVFVLLAHWAVGQFVLNQGSYTVAQGNSSLTATAPTTDKRIFLQIRNTSIDPNFNPFASIDIMAGSNLSSTSLAHIAREYNFPSSINPFAGFGQVYSRDRGLILRTGSPENPFGVIKFMTATNTNPVWFAERMRIDANGNVGIGTENPKSKVQVTDGDVYIDNPNRGIIMKDVNGGCWRITLGVVGNFVSTPIVCP
jgi:hypothetical protein